MPRKRLFGRLLATHLSVAVVTLVLAALSLAGRSPESASSASRWFIVAALAFAAAALLALAVSRDLTAAISSLRDGVQKLIQGRLDHRLSLSGPDELAELAERLNAMTIGLQERLDDAFRERNEQQAVLASMVEGVIAVDDAERVLDLNQAAGELLGVEADHARGRAIQEVVRNSQLQRLISIALQARKPQEGELTLHAHGAERHVRADVSVLRGADGRAQGAVIVMNDVTRLLQLERIRRDFVANVSHELKTPITSIKGFVETLLAGAIHQPADAERFLNIIARQAERLQSIIEDLLSLSRVEQDAAQSQIELADSNLRKVLENALFECEFKAREKEILFDLECDPAIHARINAPLLEQAVVNLVDNSIKYSPPKSTVRVGASSSPGEVAVFVADQGCGIDRSHIPRLFERFYRVDKARSRKQGGTGLGLAIVKHIAQAHSGSVTVDTAPGRGSNFSIHLPAA